MHYPNPTKCEICAKVHDLNLDLHAAWKCYHKPMITRNHTEELRNEMMHIENQLSEKVETVQKESKLNITSYDNIEAVSDPLSIDFAPEMQMKL